MDDAVPPFPFVRTYLASDAATLFENLRRHVPRLSRHGFRLRSYRPSGRPPPYLPPRFRGEPLLVESGLVEYFSIDVLSDLFVEDLRLSTRRYDEPATPLERWRAEPALRHIVLDQAQLVSTPPARWAPQDRARLRDAFYQHVKEAKCFRPTWAKGLIEAVRGPASSAEPRLRILDPSAGWGDRLLTAMAGDHEYVGFDPNRALMPRYEQMIAQFGSTHRQQVHCEPFERVGETEHMATLRNSFDLAMLSLPFFNLEIYDAADPNQSTQRYPNLDDWRRDFLHRTLALCWQALRVGGTLVMHLVDTPCATLCESTNAFIESTLPGASWEGIVGLSATKNIPAPAWVWRKAMPTARIVPLLATAVPPSTDLAVAYRWRAGAPAPPADSESSWRGVERARGRRRIRMGPGARSGK